MSWLREKSSRRAASANNGGTCSSRPVHRVLVSDMFRRHAAESLPRDVQGFVYGLMQFAGLGIDDFPRDAVLSAAADFYLAEVASGGHNGFITNLEAYPTTFEQISEGLGLVGLDEVAAVYAELLDYEAADPEHFWSTDWQDPVLQSLDERLGRITGLAYESHANWLIAQSFIRVIPADQYSWKFVIDTYSSGGLDAVH